MSIGPFNPMVRKLIDYSSRAENLMLYIEALGAVPNDPGMPVDLDAAPAKLHATPKPRSARSEPTAAYANS